jgi:hypothetical protein
VTEFSQLNKGKIEKTGVEVRGKERKQGRKKGRKTIQTRITLVGNVSTHRLAQCQLFSQESRILWNVVFFTPIILSLYDSK